MTTLSSPPHTLHASLISALSAADPERALEQAFIQLRRGGNLPLVLAMIKALVRIGLGGVALRLLRSAGGLLTAEPQLAILAEQLERAPSGEVPANRLRHVFEHNLAALRDTHPSLHSVLANEDHDRSVPGIVYLSTKGNCYIFRNVAGTMFDCVLPVVDQVEHAASLSLPVPSLGSGYLLVGVPVPAVWRRLTGSRTTDGYWPPIDIVETDLQVLRLWLRVVEIDAALTSGRLSLFVGSDAVEHYREFLIAHPTRQPATECITNRRPRWQPPVLDKAFGESIVRAATNRKRDVKKKLDAIYEARHVNFWRDRFATAGRTSPPLCIVGFTSRYSTVIQHSMRDLASAFTRLGCTFHLVKQANDSTAAVDVMGALSELQPDLIVVINHLRTEMRDCIPANIPYMCWIQDSMQSLCDPAAGKSIGPFDLVLGHSPDAMTSVYAYPIDSFLATNNRTSPDVFSAEPIDPSELEPYQCDVSYAGHGSGTPQQLIQEISDANAALQRYLQEIATLAQRRLQANSAFTTQDLVDVVLEAERSSGHPPLPPELRRSVIIPSAQRLFDRLLRHETLEWTARWAKSRGRRFCLFGRGWNQHPTLAPFACGKLENGQPLRCLYQASAVSLQINGYSSLHQRLLDGVASGGFLLSRYVPADFIRAPFSVIRNFIQVHHVAGLPQLMEYAEKHPQLAAAFNEAEALTGTRLRPSSDPVRAAQAEAHVQCSSLSVFDFTDAGLFELLKSGKGVPQRAAADLEGFASTVFRSEAELHQMLDRYVDDPAARLQIAKPMRASVLAHDTYDQLAPLVLSAFQARWCRDQH